jgi:hypothetical protein
MYLAGNARLDFQKASYQDSLVMKQRSSKSCSRMKKFLPPITCVFVGMAATLVSSCARDAATMPPDPVPSAGYGYRSPPVESQNLPPPGPSQYGLPPAYGSPAYGSPPGASQYGPPPAYSPPPSASQYGPPPTASQYGSPPDAQGPLVVAPQYGQSPGASQYGQPPSYQYGSRVGQ